MDGRPHQRPLHDRPALESARQLLAAEVLEARPQPDVRVRRVLVLDAAQALERPRDGQRRAFEEQLPGEQRPVQLPLREYALVHGRNASSRSSSAASSSRTLGSRAAQRLDAKTLLLDLPGSRHEAVDEDGLRDITVGRDHATAIPLREDPRALGRGVGEQWRSPTWEQPDGRRRVFGRSRCARQVVEQPAGFVAEGPRGFVEHGADRRGRHAYPRGHVVDRRGAEGSEVAAEEMPHRLPARHLRGAAPNQSS